MKDRILSAVLGDDVTNLLGQLLIFQLLDRQSFQSLGEVGPLRSFSLCEVLSEICRGSPAANLL